MVVRLHVQLAGLAQQSVADDYVTRRPGASAAGFGGFPGYDVAQWRASVDGVLSVEEGVVKRCYVAVQTEIVAVVRGSGTLEWSRGWYERLVWILSGSVSWI